MAADYSVLAVGDEISSKTYVLDTEAVAKYVAAVGDQSSIFDPTDDRAVAPAMAIAALSLRGVVSDLGVPRGTVHAGQELEFSGVARLGDELTCKAILLQNSVRGGTRFVAVQLSVTDRAGRHVMSGKSTLVMPS